MKIEYVFYLKMGIIFSKVSDYPISKYDTQKYRRYANNKKLVQFMKWRRYNLAFVVIPLSLGTMFWNIYTNYEKIKDRLSLDENDTQIYVIYSICTYVSLNLADFIQLIFTLLALWYHDRWTLSRRYLATGFFISYAVLFLPYIIPLERLLDNYINNIIDGIQNNLMDTCEKFTTYDNCNKIFNEFDQSLQLIMSLYVIVKFIVSCITNLAPSSISLIPAIMRGAGVVGQLTADGKEMNYLMKYIPILLIPLLTFYGIILIQLTASYFMMGTVITAIAALATRGWYRLGFGSIAITLFILYATQVTKDGNEYIVGLIKDNIGWEGLGHFVLKFLVKYNTLTILMSDALLKFMMYSYDIGLMRTTRNAVEIDLTPLVND